MNAPNTPEPRQTRNSTTRQTPRTTPSTLRSDERAITPLMGILVIFAVIATVTFAITAVAGPLSNAPTGDQPQTTFTYDYNTTTDNLTITHAGGDVIHTQARIDIYVNEPGVHNLLISDADLKDENDSVTATNVRLGDEIIIRWTHIGDEATINTHRVGGTTPNPTGTGPGHYAITSTDTPTNATKGDTLTVTTTITNRGGEQTTQNVTLDVGDNGVNKTKTVTLNAEETTTVTFDYTVPTDADTGWTPVVFRTANDSRTERVYIHNATGTTDTAPTATIDNVADNSVCKEGNPHDGDPCSSQDKVEYDVTWSVTDDNGLNSVTVQLIDSNGNVVDSASPPVSGTTASGTDTLTDTEGFGDTYTIKLIVTDSASQQDTDSVTDTADGN